MTRPLTAAQVAAEIQRLVAAETQRLVAAEIQRLVAAEIHDHDYLDSLSAQIGATEIEVEIQFVRLHLTGARLQEGKVVLEAREAPLGSRTHLTDLQEDR